MQEINAIIEKGSDGLYAVRTDFKIGRSFPGSFGESVEEANEDFEAAIEDAIKDARANGVKSPEKEALKVVYKYDIPSFFNYFDFINVAKFAALVGINESKLRQYKSGIAYPGEKTTKKILSTVEISARSLRMRGCDNDQTPSIPLSFRYLPISPRNGDGSLSAKCSNHTFFLARVTAT